MIHPSLPEFKRLAKGHSVVPIWVECLSDHVKPLSLFHGMYAKSPACFLLESVEGGEHLGRYSFAAFEPRVLFRGAGDAVTIQRGRRSETRRGVEPLDELRRLLAGHRAPEVKGLPRFYGGAVGAISYDVARRFERLPSRARDDLKVPDMVFMLTGDMFIFDHVAHTVKIVRNVPVERGASLEAGYRSAARDLLRLAASVRPASMPLTPFAAPGRAPLPADAADKKRYMEAVRKAKGYIAAGDIIQVVPSRRVSLNVKAHPLAVYRALRRVNPSPYMFFIRDGGTHIIGSSPEMQVRLENGVAETRPIAGTRPRGADAAEDARLEKSLLADPKERAEHVMLVDLARNDLGRVCRPGTVKAADFMTVERYSHVMHLVSKVTGRLKPGTDALDLFRATFPAGTLSGAPKIRAMEIIEELEPARRGFYGGAVGYVSYTGNMDLAIAIRTILMAGKTAHLQAGAGVVADSSPEAEFEETQNKLGAVVAALRAGWGEDMILMIDNYDSFTYNIVQYLGELGAQVVVRRNDEVTVEDIRRMKPARIVVSPGPCTPREAGVSVDAIKAFGGKVPLLGVCLGHQSLGFAFGGKIIRAKKLMHGKTSRIKHDGKGVFAGLKNPFTATRYHSLVIERKSCPKDLIVTATSEDGEIMGVRHRTLKALEGVQFHPESILTEGGKDLLKNFLRMKI